MAGQQWKNIALMKLEENRIAIMIFSNKDNIDNFDKITLRSYGKYM
jgi:hypothetical protein